MNPAKGELRVLMALKTTEVWLRQAPVRRSKRAGSARGRRPQSAGARATRGLTRRRRTSPSCRVLGKLRFMCQWSAYACGAANVDTMPGRFRAAHLCHGIIMHMLRRSSKCIMAPFVCMVLLQGSMLSQKGLCWGSTLSRTQGFGDLSDFISDLGAAWVCRSSTTDEDRSAAGSSKKASHVGVIIASVLFALMLLACLGALPYNPSEAAPISCMASVPA